MSEVASVFSRKSMPVGRPSSSSRTRASTESKSSPPALSRAARRRFAMPESVASFRDSASSAGSSSKACAWSYERRASERMSAGYRS